MKVIMKLFLCVLGVMVLSGCGLVIEGAGAIVDNNKAKFKDIEINFRQGYDSRSIRDIESAAFLISSGKTDWSAPGAGTTLSDNLAKEFLIKGLNVEEYTTLETTINKKKLGLDTSSVLVAAELSGIDAVFMGAVETGYGYKRGFFGIGAEMKNGIQGATVKLIDVKTKQVILIMSANYKKPKSSKQVASDIAEAFFEQRNPTTQTE